jgi:hypothetical protein
MVLCISFGESMFYGMIISFILMFLGFDTYASYVGIGFFVWWIASMILNLFKACKERPCFRKKCEFE